MVPQHPTRAVHRARGPCRHPPITRLRTVVCRLVALLHRRDPTGRNIVVDHHHRAVPRPVGRTHRMGASRARRPLTILEPLHTPAIHQQEGHHRARAHRLHKADTDILVGCHHHPAAPALLEQLDIREDLHHRVPATQAVDPLSLGIPEGRHPAPEDTLVRLGAGIRAAVRLSRLEGGHLLVVLVATLDPLGHHLRK